MSWRIVVLRRATSGPLNGRRMSDSATAETTNVAASTTSSWSTGSTTSSAPATSGPRTLAPANVAWIRPFAVTRSAWSTRLGIAPNAAASKKIPSVDVMKTTARIHHTLSTPAIAATGTDPTAAMLRSRSRSSAAAGRSGRSTRR